MFLFFVFSLQTNYLTEYLNGGIVRYTISRSNVSTFQVPNDVYELEVRMWGSGGVDADFSGSGGYTYGKFAVTPGENLGIEVGSPTWALYNHAQSSENSFAGTRTAIWRNNQLNEILVAGGGGARGKPADGGRGGAGGGLIGQNSKDISSVNPSYCSSYSYAAGGGTQTEGGKGGTATFFSGHNSGVNGGRNFGSRGISPSQTGHQGGPGGGGFYGGGSGGASCYSVSGGGGGSGYISSIVTNGISISGNYAIPGNSNDPLRGSYGNPGFGGVIIIDTHLVSSNKGRFDQLISFVSTIIIVALL